MREENIEKMDFKELRQEVMNLRDELAIFKRKFEDAIYNIDDDNFSPRTRVEKDNMHTQISQTAEQILLQAEKIEENNTYYLSQFSVTAEKIDSVVNSVNELKGEDFSTQILQTAKSIQLVANASYSKPETVDDFDAVTSKDTKKVYYSKKNNRHYHYDGFSWVETESGVFGSVFSVTSTGFSFNNNVSISGNLITSGKISADRIDANNLRVSKLYSMTGNAYAKVYSGTGDFGLYESDAASDAYPYNEKCVWGVYVTDPGAHVVNFYSYGHNYLGYTGYEDDTIYPKGKWCFDSCTVTDWGTNAPVATFG